MNPPRTKHLLAMDNERRFQLLLDAVHDYAIYLLDADGFVASWNAGAQRFKGYAADEIIGEHFSRFYTPEDRATGFPGRALRIAAEQGRFEAEGWRVRKDGTRFWASVVIDPVRDESGTLVGFAKVTRDISDKKDAERALFRSEQNFRLLVEGVRDYAIYLLDPAGNVSSWNTGAEAIKGYKADEIVGQHFSRFYTEADRAAEEPAAALRTALAHGKFEKEALRVRKDGSTFWAHVVIDPIHDDAGVLTGFAKITRDVTDRRRAQEELDQAREALAQSQKMEAIGRLTGGVAHDFNNLLTVIRSSADLLQLPNITEEKRQRYIAAIAETADRAARLTGQLLAFARRQPLEPETFSVGDQLRGLEPLIATTVGSPVAIDIQVPEDIGAVTADPDQFEAAVLNIAINARDAMPQGGTLRISARNALHVPAVRRHAAVEGEFIAVEIADTGTGMDEDTLSRIFEPFFTTKAVGRGTGLGLSQAFGFAKQSGGEIAVESRPGKGSAFTIYLPRTPVGAMVGGSDDHAAVPRPHLPTQRVLLVEDNEVVGRFALSLLEELGQTVVWAPNGEAALKTLEAEDGAFDLVFTDVVMPGMTGIELAKEIDQRWPGRRIVLTSGYSHVLAEEGSHGFPLLRKPYSIGRLMEVLGVAPAEEREA
ncbi:hybrid sensor histidine kinase/response regulator [Sphingomonas jeddahensis]|uniref:histidine kinase n=1 Tax=Sphingomonas jeddahensis TaxID=1915074 RepID=A0A1V2EWN7_9SPHN|nr:PAS domain-containing sensor histidine kinase [Sphingomonas jeddahensis]ONF96953.1 Blue-light-activated protein [Sphingomonas jeddahensis]